LEYLSSICSSRGAGLNTEQARCAVIADCFWTVEKKRGHGHLRWKKIVSVMRDGFGGHKESHWRAMMANDAAQQKKPEGCSFVIFGVTGDLAHRLIIQ
jgi:hypothetical protein